jgi:glycosyltransferase involved in cell wall biosynthesis
MNATAVNQPVTAGSEAAARGKIGWLFALGHGHYTQFLNFQESFPPEEAYRAVWIGLDYGKSGDILSRVPVLPRGLRLRRNVGWHARTGLAQQPKWDALFFAICQLSLFPLIARHRSYLYVDLTPSLTRELAPWYADQHNRNPLLNWLKIRLHARHCRAARGIVAMSEWSAAGVRRDYQVPANRVHVTPPGANLGRWRFVDRSQRSPAQPVRILLIGGEFLRKGGGLL